jgi:hypothetical protein
MMMMIMIMRRRRRRRRREAQEDRFRSTAIYAAIRGRKFEALRQGRSYVRFCIKTVCKFSHSSVYIVNSGLRVSGGQKFIFALGPVMSQIGPTGDKDDDDDDDNNNNDNNNKAVVKCE